MTALAFGRTRGHLLFERNLMVYRRTWMTIFSGFFEPLFYLFSLGLGLGHFVGSVHGVSYASYIAPALLASSAMNGAVNEAMTNVFCKLRYGKTYDSMLSTPLGPTDVAVGETAWAQFRGAALRDRLHHHDRRARADPLVVGDARAAGRDRRRLRLRRDRRSARRRSCAAGRTSTRCSSCSCRCSSSRRRSIPLSVYPVAIQWIVRFSPLYHAIELMRSFTLGTVAVADLGHAAYLIGLGLFGIWLARRRMAGMLLT